MSKRVEVYGVGSNSVYARGWTDVRESAGGQPTVYYYTRTELDNGGAILSSPYVWGYGEVSASTMQVEKRGSYQTARVFWGS